MTATEFRAIRERLGETQASLAARLGVTLVEAYRALQQPSGYRAFIVSDDGREREVA